MYKIGQIVKYEGKLCRVLAYNPEEVGCVLEVEYGWTCDTGRKRQYPIFSEDIPKGTKCWWAMYSSTIPMALFKKAISE